MTDDKTLYLLQASKIQFSYRNDAVPAVSNGSLELFPGKIQLLLGENGAGKSTLARILARQIRPQKGNINLKDDLTLMTYLPQHLSSLPDCSLADYLWMFYSRDNSLLPFFAGKTKRSRHIAGILSEVLGNNFSEDSLHEQVGQISSNILHLYAAIVQLSRKDCKIHILDEPTAVLSESEAESLYTFMRRVLKESDNGKSILLITHRIDEALHHSDGFFVMYKGEVVFSGSGSDSAITEKIYASMFGRKEHTSQGDLGRKNSDKFSMHMPDQTSVKHERSAVLTIEGARAEFYDLCPLVNLHFTVNAGEIHAITGIRDEGLEQLERLLAGDAELLSGEIHLKNATYKALPMHELRTHTLRFVPSDRTSRGTALGLYTYENLGLLERESYFRGNSFSEKCQKVLRTRLGFADFVAKQFSRSRERLMSPTHELSGGMIQSLIIDREFNGIESSATESVLVVLANPSWGLDASKREQLYKRIRNLSQYNHGILLLTTELDEAVALGHRISFIHSGRLYSPSAEVLSQFKDNADSSLEQLFLGNFPADVDTTHQSFGGLT